MIVEYLVFSGGGMRGLAYVAAYSELCASCTVRLRSLVGTSIGALVCALLSVGYTGQELEAMVTELNLSDLTNISLMSVFSAWGLDDRSRLEKFVDDRLYEKTGRRAMTINGPSRPRDVRCDQFECRRGGLICAGDPPRRILILRRARVHGRAREGICLAVDLGNGVGDGARGRYVSKQKGVTKHIIIIV